jgi:pentatricopeptide repeat protein
MDAQCSGEAGSGCAGIKGNVVLYTTLMNACRRGGQPELAMRIFRTMETDGLQLDVVMPPSLNTRLNTRDLFGCPSRQEALPQWKEVNQSLHLNSLTMAALLGYQ